MQVGPPPPNATPDIGGCSPPLRTGPSSMPTSRMIIWRVSRAGRLAGGLGGAMTVTWRSRGRVTPSDSRTQRHGWAASGNSASRVMLSSNGTTTSHGLHKLEIVVIVDSRVLDLCLYYLINNIQFSSVRLLGRLKPQNSNYSSSNSNSGWTPALMSVN